jgi:hypothetical protein
VIQFEANEGTIMAPIRLRLSPKTFLRLLETAALERRSVDRQAEWQVMQALGVRPEDEQDPIVEDMAVPRIQQPSRARRPVNRQGLQLVLPGFGDLKVQTDPPA